MKSRKEEMWITICSVILLLSLIGMFSLIEIGKKQYYIGIVSSIVMVVITHAILIFWIRKMRKENEEKSRLKLESQQKELHLQYLEETEGLYKELDILKRESREHIANMKKLLEKRQYEELKEYFSSVGQIMNQGDCIFMSGNEIIDVVMSQKISRALSKGIHIKCDVQYVTFENIKHIDLCSLLSNVLDNAIEAAEQCEDKLICVSIRKDKNCLILKEDNGYKKVLTDRGKRLKTTKKEKEVHGYGWRSMENTVKKYGGMLDYVLKDGRFYITIVMEDTDKIVQI